MMSRRAEISLFDRSLAAPTSRILIMLVLAAPLHACSIKRSLDQETMKEISKSCALVGSRITRMDGHRSIDVHFKDNTPEKIRCMTAEIEKRNLAAGLYFGDLGDDRPPLTPKRQSCVDDLVKAQGLDAGNNMQSVCGVE